MASTSAGGTGAGVELVTLNQTGCDEPCPFVLSEAAQRSSQRSGETTSEEGKYSPVGRADCFDKAA